MASGLYPQDLRGRSLAASEDDASQLQLCRTLVRTDVNKFYDLRHSLENLFIATTRRSPVSHSPDLINAPNVLCAVKGGTVWLHARLWDYPYTFFDDCSRTIRAPGRESRLVC